MTGAASDLIITVHISYLTIPQITTNMPRACGPRAETEKHLGNADKVSFLTVYALVKCVKSLPTIKSFVILYLFRHTYIFPTDGFNFVISVSKAFHDLIV